MSDHTAIAETQAARIVAKLPDLLESYRDEIVEHAGVAVDPSTIRVRKRELMYRVRDEALSGVSATVPEDDRDAVVEMVADIVDPAAADVAWAQFGDVTIATMVEEFRVPIEALREFEPDLAAAFEADCDAILAGGGPDSNDLLGHVDAAFEALKDAGKSGDRAKLVPARTLMELREYLVAHGERLDGEHAPAVAPGR
jgi:hypothetical protein